ncbi:MAG: RDD family protein [Ktedonobacteraceae bacterium]|nr:RDD family protein [Ktedonobacteraceae bacterium]
MNAPPYDNPDEQPPRPGQPVPERPEERTSRPPQPPQRPPQQQPPKRDMYGDAPGSYQPADHPEGQQPPPQPEPQRWQPSQPQRDIYGNVSIPSQPTDQQAGQQPSQHETYGQSYVQSAEQPPEQLSPFPQPGSSHYGAGYGAQSIFGRPPSAADPHTPLPPTGSYAPTPESSTYEQGAPQYGQREYEQYAPQYGQQRYGAYAMPQYAGVGIRFVAILIDSILIGVLAAIVESLFANTSMSSVTAAVVMFAYFIVMEAMWGATLGKMALKLRVFKTDGTPIGWQESAIRNLLRIIDGLFFYIVGAAFAWSSPMRQRLGDRAASTVVVRQ